MTDNELIAEFMGLERAKANHDFFFIAEYHAYVSPENILYHKSWDWLMPVVEKIESIPSITGIGFYSIEIQQGYVKVHATQGIVPIMFNCSVEGSKMRAVYKACVAFIKWYNKK